MHIRRLTQHDAAVYHRLRLRALGEHPEAFGASPEDEQALSLDQVGQQLEDAAGNTVTFGACLGERLVGIVTLHRFTRPKTRHKAMLGGMYVAPEARSTGVGTALVDRALAHARTMDGVEDVTLAVTMGNQTARQLYLRAGFTPYGIEPRYIKHGNRYFDIEWMILSLVGARVSEGNAANGQPEL